MADPTALDYLGIEAPLSLAEKPALPVGSPVGVSAGPSAPSGGGVAAGAGAGAAGGPGGTVGVSAMTPAASAGTVTTTPSGEPGIPGDPQGPAAVEIAGELGATSPGLAQILLALGASGSKVWNTLKQLRALSAEGPEGPILNPSEFSLTGDPDAPVLDPSKVSLGGDPNAPALEPGKFDLADTRLDGALPNALPPLPLMLGDAAIPAGMLSLTGEGAPVLSAADFSLAANASPSAVNPSDFSLGVDTAIDSGVGAASQSLPYIGAIISAIGSLLPSLTGGGKVDVGGALTKAGIAAAQAIASYTNPVYAAMNIPQAADALYHFIEGDEAAVRRARRTQDATTLQGEILAPIMQARTQEEFDAALAQEVGGAKIGDAFAAMLWNNLNGTYYGDTAHRWAPDITLLPLMTYLTERGYTGQKEPKRGNVGGVGEIIAGAGGRLIPPSEYAPGGSLFPGVARDEGGQMENIGRNVGIVDLAPGGALGWESVLRQIAGTTDAPSVVNPEVMHQGGVRDTSSEGGGFVDPQTGERVPATTGLDPEYLAALRQFSPAAAQKVEETTQAIIDNMLYNANFNYA